ncbi:MAG: type II toxin-antitoxin system VapC family toxin [Planctomycetota bacterium]|nr:type II toxin-antitoxin system VapC family toxin [Planctomycetota bacterium]
MNGKTLLDTNAVIAVFANDAAVLAMVSQAGECFLPAVALGEPYYGARHSAKVADNLAKLKAFCDTVTILPCDEETASAYGRIKNELRTKGRPIPENDIWIAAIAAQHQLELLSNDDHFDDVDGLNRKSW